MKLALIPPSCLLGDTNKTGMQMMLPGPVLERDSDYVHCYRKHARDPEQYLILDNGAAERRQISHDMLFDMAVAWQPQELVLPDIMADGPATLKASETFMQHQAAESLRARGTKLAFVVQGSDEDAAYETLQVFAESWWAQFVDVIHLPRLLVTTGAPDSRIRLAVRAQALLGDKYECHFLGANTIWPQEIKFAARYDYIRSMDTSTPYYMAHWQRPLDGRIWDGALERPTNYFSRHRSSFQGSDYYVNTFLAWANGREPDAQTSPGKV